jgi:hypothetical protein
MRFPPGVVVMVVDHVGDLAADDPPDPLRHPFPAGVAVLPASFMAAM